MSDKNSGVSFVSLLTLLLIGLKLTKAINWSWFWVLSPMWLSVLFGIVVFLGTVLWHKKSKH